MLGIDVSHWQGDIDFKKVKNAGYQFVIIKAGGCDKGTQTSISTYVDNCFNKNYWAARKEGLYVGAYYFAGKNVLGADEGKKCALEFLQIISAKTFEMPIFLDVEISAKSSKVDATEAAIGFCNLLEDFNYFAGIYASDISGFKERLEHDRLNAYCHWTARYGKKPEYCKNYQIWQKTSTGKVPGINGNVDIDETDIDFKKIMIKAHLNGYHGY